MDHHHHHHHGHQGSDEERIVSERLRNMMNQVNLAAQTQLAGVQDHVNFTLQVSFLLLQSSVLILFVL